jgi:hypothetical protein
MDAAATDPLGLADRAEHRLCHRSYLRTPNPSTARLSRLPGDAAPEQTARRRRLEAACQRALALGACSYKSLESILSQGLERLPLAQQNLPLLPEEHINLRGPGYYH